jgi:hypothetical protein
VSGSSDDAPVRQRGAVRPPPSGVPEDAPDAVDVPRMEPPPPSLEAMVQSGQPSQRADPGGSWLPWILLVLVVAGITAYVAR